MNQNSTEQTKQGSCQTGSVRTAGARAEREMPDGCIQERAHSQRLQHLQITKPELNPGEEGFPTLALLDLSFPVQNCWYYNFGPLLFGDCNSETHVSFVMVTFPWQPAGI